MGKLRNQRKLKKCDPFYKGERHQNVDNNYDLPPSKADLDNDQATRCRFVANQMGRKKRNLMEKSTKVKKPKTGKSKIPKLPGESDKKYLDRLDKEVSIAINKTIADTRKVRSKRKEHLKQRDEKVKSQKQRRHDEDAGSDFQKDVFKFGEVVNEPPQIKFKPRKARTKSLDPSSLKLAKLFKPPGDEDATGTDIKLKATKRKNMTPLEKVKFDKSRQDSIDAYRQNKQRILQKRSLES